MVAVLLDGAAECHWTCQAVWQRQAGSAFVRWFEVRAGLVGAAVFAAVRRMIMAG